jgi:hypothetical protein
MFTCQRRLFPWHPLESLWDISRIQDGAGVFYPTRHRPMNETMHIQESHEEFIERLPLSFPSVPGRDRSRVVPCSKTNYRKTTN